MGKIKDSQAWALSDERCHYCRIELVPETATRDHVVSRDAAWFKGRRNIVIACKPCNQFKGLKSLHTFLTSDFLAERKLDLGIGDELEIDHHDCAHPYY